MDGSIQHGKSGSVAASIGKTEQVAQITEEEKDQQRLKNKTGHDSAGSGAPLKVRYNRVGPITMDTSHAVVIRDVDGSKSYRRGFEVTGHIHQGLIAELPCGVSREQRLVVY